MQPSENKPAELADPKDLKVAENSKVQKTDLKVKAPNTGSQKILRILQYFSLLELLRYHSF